MKPDSWSAAGGPARRPPQADEAVFWMMRGEDLEQLSWELGVNGATLGTWREKVLAGGKAALKSQPEDDRDAAGLRIRVGRTRSRWIRRRRTAGALPDRFLLHTEVIRLQRRSYRIQQRKGFNVKNDTAALTAAQPAS